MMKITVINEKKIPRIFRKLILSHIVNKHQYASSMPVIIETNLRIMINDGDNGD